MKENEKEAEKKKPPDWVLASASCTIDGAFDRILQRIKEDVEAANKHAKVNRDRKFSVDSPEGCRQFCAALRRGVSGRISAHARLQEHSPHILPTQQYRLTHGHLSAME